MKNFIKSILLAVLYVVTIASGLIIVAAVISVIKGSRDILTILAVSGVVFLICIFIISKRRGGWSELISELITPWSHW